MRLILKLSPSSSTVKVPHGRRSNFGDVSKASSCMQQGLRLDARSPHPLTAIVSTLIAFSRSSRRKSTDHYPQTSHQPPRQRESRRHQLFIGNNSLFGLIKGQADICARLCEATGRG